jgi:hypothetical protein
MSSMLTSIYGSQKDGIKGAVNSYWCFCWRLRGEWRERRVGQGEAAVAFLGWKMKVATEGCHGGEGVGSLGRAAGGLGGLMILDPFCFSAFCFSI